MKFGFHPLVKSTHFPSKWYQNYAHLPTGSKVIDKSIWLPWRVPFWEIGLRKFVFHTTALQQLQFRMPETVIKHHIWPLKVMSSNRKMPEAPDFDENRKSIFLTCRSKIIAFCIVTEYLCDSFRAVGSHMIFLHANAHEPRFIISSVGLLWEIESVRNFDSEETRPQSARNAQHETVTQSRGGHA